MRVTFFIFCAVLETACTQRIHIPSGYMANADPSQSSTADSVNSASAGAQWKNIAVLIDAQDLRRALRRESTLYVNVFDCSSPARGEVSTGSKYLGDVYPSNVAFDGINVNQERDRTLNLLDRRAGPVEIDAFVPDVFVKKLNKPCFRMTGASYLGWRIDSNIASLMNK